MSKVTYVLEGLGCANCAAKIESAVKAMEGVEEAYVDFSKSKLVYAFDEAKQQTIPMDAIIKIVHTYEPDVVVRTPESATSETEVFSEARERLRLLIGLILFAVAMLFKDLPNAITLGLLLTTYLLSGYPVIAKSFKNIVNRQWFDENFLMFVATVGAIGIGEYPEAVAVMLFYEIGEYFQDLAVGKSRHAIEALMDIRPEIAHLVKDGQTLDKSPEFIDIGDIIRVKPGERVPLDGIVLKGETAVDTSALTGESKPIYLLKGDTVLSGSVVISGVVEITVSKRYEDSTVTKILELVEDATAHKSPTENFITKFARYYTPIVVLLAAMIIAIPTLYYGVDHFSTWLYRGLIFLVISCPCALVISVPLGFFSGIGNASGHGILIKGSNYLEALNTIDTVVFDKTGTLTHGKLSIADVNPASNITSDALLAIAQRVEAHSNHPIAKAILAAGDMNKSVQESSSATFGFADLSERYEELSGLGVKATLEGKTFLAGTEKLLHTYGIAFTPITSPTSTIVYIAEGDVYLGYITLEDHVKTEAASVIHALKAQHKQTIMLTGDQNAVASAVATALTLDAFYAELMPADKYAIVRGLIDEGHHVAFVGDGINDAPVLAGATLGLSMGDLGSDAAIEASDIVIMKDQLTSILNAFSIAAQTKKIVTQNIVFAIGIKIAIMALGVFGLSSMWMAIFADVGVALLAVLNAMRILRFRPVKRNSLS
jgi:Cd2+/Zn2+-exporting ATPase